MGPHWACVRACVSGSSIILNRPPNKLFMPLGSSPAELTTGAVPAVTRLRALFPFGAAGARLQIGQGKVLCFDNARWAERRAVDWLVSFSSQSMIGPGALMGLRAGNVGCPPPPSPLAPLSPPHTPLFPRARIVTHCLLRLEM